MSYAKRKLIIVLLQVRTAGKQDCWRQSGTGGDLMLTYKNLFVLLLSFSIALVSTGCSKKEICVTDNIILRGKEKKIHLIVDKNIVCGNIYDVWVQNNYIYGWFYSAENKYIMFKFNISAKTIQVGNSAKNRINELQLPLNNWTDYSEIFDDHITNQVRHNLFFQNIDAIRQKSKNRITISAILKNSTKGIAE